MANVDQEPKQVYDTLRIIAAQGSQVSVLAKVVAPLLKIDNTIASLEHNPIVPCRLLFTLKQELMVRASATDQGYNKEDLALLSRSGGPAVEPGLEFHTKLVEMLALFLRCHGNPKFSLAVVDLFTGHLAAGEVAKPLKQKRPPSVPTSTKTAKISQSNQDWKRRLVNDADFKPTLRSLGKTGPALLDYLQNAALTDAEKEDVEEVLFQKLTPSVKKAVAPHNLGGGKGTQDLHFLEKWQEAMVEFQNDPKKMVEKFCATLKPKEEQEE
jgi:hypothetical protein